PGLASRHDTAYPYVPREFLQAIDVAPDEILFAGLPGHRHERQERAPFADQDALFEYPVPENGEFHVLRRKFFAVRQDENVLQASTYENPALPDFRKIARMQPIFAIERLRARLRIVPIALHDARTPREQLAVRRDSHLDIVERHADRFRNVALQSIHRDHGRGPGPSATLEARQPEPEEQPRNRGVERGTAEDREPHPAAEPRAHRSCDAVAQQGENDPVSEPRFAALGSPSRRHYQLEKPLLGRRLGESRVDASCELF